MSLIHISKPPISKHPYQSTHLTVPRTPFSRSVIPSLPHFAISSLRFCLHSDNPKIVSIPTNSISTASNPSKLPANNQYFNNQQSIKASNPSKNQHSAIPPFHYFRKGVEGPIYRQDTEVPSYTVCDCHQSPCNGY